MVPRFRSKVRAAGTRIPETDTRRIKPATKRADPHYLTAEHKAWSAEVIRRSGGVCQGRYHRPDRPRATSRLFADHVVELRDGGAPFDPANGQALCGSCHTAKTIAERVRRLRG